MTEVVVQEMPARAVAVIGAGPAGLVTARWLAACGFQPVLFEAAAGLGGQWNGSSPHSATWEGMCTNTSRVMTCFSDLDHVQGTPVYPSRKEIHDYLISYARRFGLLDLIRCHTRIEQVQKGPGGGWLLHSTRHGQTRVERFSRVAVASGRHVAGAIPEVTSLDRFTGSLGAAHSSQYAGSQAYRGKDVLVAGCSISALEIASDLALSGARSVTVSYRRQRYVLPKLIAGRPTDHVIFTRSAALASEILPAEALAAGLKATILRAAGSPDQVGAMVPDENVFSAGITQSQHFLPLVAEGRIVVRPWIDRVDGRSVRFVDGSSVAVDAILLGTGYRLSLPFLGSDVAAKLGLDESHIDLCDHTFHPDLDGLAFVGLCDLIGPTFPVLELQARWIAYAWAGIIPLDRQELAAGLAQYRAVRGSPQAVPMHAMAVRLARRAGVEPCLSRWPGLERALLFGPMSPVSFRLDGPDRLNDASRSTAAAAAAFGMISNPEMTAEEQDMRELLRREPANAQAA